MLCVYAFLSRNAARFFERGTCTKTRQTIAIAAKLYSEPCTLEGIYPIFLFLLPALASWMACLEDKCLQVKTIKAYLTRLCSRHVDMGCTTLGILHNPILQRIIARIPRLHGGAGKKERRPIARSLLLRMWTLCDRTTPSGANLYAAFLRIGKFIYSANDRVDPGLAD